MLGLIGGRPVCLSGIAVVEFLATGTSANRLRVAGPYPPVPSSFLKSRLGSQPIRRVNVGEYPASWPTEANGRCGSPSWPALGSRCQRSAPPSSRVRRRWPPRPRTRSPTTATTCFCLLIAQRRSARPRDERHPFGYGREAYFWALLAALGAFIVGAAFSLREGITELLHPSSTSSFGVAYAVLAFSTVFDLLSLRQSAHQMSTEAQRANRTILDQSQATSDPSLRGVFNEDAISVAGDIFAFAGLALSQITGSSVPQAVAAVLIALVLIRISLRLVSRNHDFLVGQPVPPKDRDRVQTLLLGYAGVTAVGELVVTYVGPDQVWVLARIDVSDDLRSSQVTSLVRDLEAALKRESKYIYRVDIVVVGTGRGG